MSEDYILVRDIVYDHNERMMNIKKYYPYFKLAETSFSQYREGRYSDLDMGYILMALLRFFIEENNFKEKNVTYNEYAFFMSQLLIRDFGLNINGEEEKNLISYIFDKVMNDGKPFTYNFFDPSDRLRKMIRIKIIDTKILDSVVYYSITSDAVAFYLDTKEIKDESSISIAQVLLGKLITTKNFKGGTEVVRRINSEVNKLKSRKNEVLGILSHDVFEGMKAYEDFVDTGIQWFEEEQKLFVKNMELIEKARKQTRAESNEKSSTDPEAMLDLYHLETEIKKAITKHQELLNACTELQIKADEIIEKAKFSKLRSSFNFSDAVNKLMDGDRADLLSIIVTPLLKQNIKKMFSLNTIDAMLSLRPDREETGELIQQTDIGEVVRFEDDIEEERIKLNYGFIIIELLDYLLTHSVSCGLKEFNNILEDKFTKNIFKNGDYYSFLIHMCQKKKYSVREVMNHPDTFFEEIMKEILIENEERMNKYGELSFELIMNGEPVQMLKIGDNFETADIQFISTGAMTTS